MVNISINGAAGRMGQTVIRLALDDKHLKIVELLDRPQAARPGMLDAGLELRQKHETGAQVMIDFSAPEAFRQRLQDCVATKTAFVSGTTGLTSEHVAELLQAAQAIPVLHTTNFSLGVTVLRRLVADAARALSDYDIEITDLHHNQKKDAPSGTTETLIEIVCDALERSPYEDLRFGRHGMVGARDKREIGVHVMRGGDAVGEHTVMFLGQGERLTLHQQAQSRDAYVRGALRAARFIAGKAPGCYTVEQVLFGG